MPHAKSRPARERVEGTDESTQAGRDGDAAQPDIATDPVARVAVDKVARVSSSEAEVGPDSLDDADKAGHRSGLATHWRKDLAVAVPDDPLLNCLALIIAMADRPVSQSALASGLPIVDGRMSPQLCVRAAERAGFAARVVRKELQQIRRSALPCILLLDGEDACILEKPVDRDTAQIVDPDGGKRSVPLSELAETYSGYALFVRPSFRYDERAQEVRLSEGHGWFWGTILRFWPVYGHVLLASVLINMFVVAMPLFIMNVYDRVVPNQALESLWALAVGVMVVFAFEFLMRNLRSYFIDTAGKNSDSIISSNILGHLLSSKLENRNMSTGSIANNIREYESLREFFTSGTVVALVDLPFIFIFIFVIWMIAGPVAYIPLAIVPLVIVVGLLLQLPMRRLMEATYRESAQKHALLVEAVEGLETIKTSTAEGPVLRDWERCVGATANTAKNARLLATLSTTFAQLGIQLATVFVIVYGVYLIADGELTMGALVAATILTGRSLAPLGVIAGMLTRIQQSRVALKGLDTLMKSPSERSPDKAYVHRPRLDGEIVFKNVVFSYPGQSRRALDGASFRIEAGEKVAFIGRVGSGKSTIARIILNLYSPQSGSVLVDGTDVAQYDPSELRRNIGYVAQDNYLFFGSVQDNICFSAPHADKETIQWAADVAGVTDFLRQTMEGLDLPVGEHGSRLSGGQRQAITIARALLLDPPVLLMDEPTSHMDNASETHLRDRLAEAIADKTLVLATHRSSLLKLVDRLIVIDSGKIVADGPRDEILAALRQGQLKAAT